MIAPHRRAHAVIWTVLGPLVLALLGAAIVVRPDPVVADRVPGTGLDWAAVADAEGIALAVDGTTATLVIGEPLRKPDVLAYWSATAPTDTLPEDAMLLGPVLGRGSQTLSLPRAGGHVTLFSLAHGTVVWTAAMPGGAP